MAVDVIATIYAAPGKVDRVAELLGNHAKWVQTNEPRTLRYELKRQVDSKTKVEELVMIETYADMEAIKEHGGTKEFRALGKILKEEGLVTAPTQIRFVKHVAGFSRL
ncbi:hypothetical protein V498_01466 [Pseudogymnoascus sp. VKM F-4517 (FW-2822)]|nr:hypothetical protein V498_01466 [Pseudogymnoascus sp. VKM F-4517 (FW-2822)]